MPHKLGFHIAHCSSEMETARAQELLTQGPGVKGWISSKFCPFPQTLVIQLAQRGNLTRIQMLAHQFIIPEKVEIYIGDVPPGHEVSLQNVYFAQLGYVALSDNVHTEHKARELKNVTVNCAGLFLKFVFHKNHLNKKNSSNQVGLIALNVLGNEVEDNNNSISPDGDGGLVPSKRKDQVPFFHDLAFAMYVDTGTATVMQMLEDRKSEAIKQERFEYANKLKATASQLQKAGELLGKLEIERKHSIELQDFEKAKKKQQTIDEYKKEVHRALGIEDLLERNGRLRKNDEQGVPANAIPPISQFSSSPSEVEARRQLGPARPSHTPVHPPPSPPKSPSPPPIKAPSDPLPSLSRGSFSPPVRSTTRPSLPRPPSAPSLSSYASATSPAIHSYAEYDERTLPALKHRIVEEVDEGDSQGNILSHRRTFLTEAEKKDAILPIDVFGELMVEKFFSKNYSEKESGLLMLQEEMKNYCSDDTPIRTDKFTRATTFLISKALRDKVYSVNLLATVTLSHLLRDFFGRNRVSKREMGTAVDRFYPDILTKTADNAPRMQTLATNAILELADFSINKKVGSVGGQLTKSLAYGIHPRTVVARATIVEELVNRIRPTGFLKDRESGFHVRQVVDFAVSALQHQNHDVRKVGERLLLTLYVTHPNAVRRALPLEDEPTRKNVLYRNIFQQMHQMDKKREAKSHLSKQAEAVETPYTPGYTDLVPSLGHPSTVTNTPSGSSSSSGFSSGGGSTYGMPPAVPQICITPDEAEVRGKTLFRLNQSSSELAEETKDKDGPETDDDKTCIFCNVYSELFSGRGMDIHYWKTCPMLMRCSHCRQVVEIASLSDHLLSECDASYVYSKCERCTEAIPNNEITDHIIRGTCTAAKPSVLANHCPLCHDNIAPWDEGWRKHLLPGLYACSANPRAYPHETKKNPKLEPSQRERTASAHERQRSIAGETPDRNSASITRRNYETGSRKRLSSSTPATPRRTTAQRWR